jgi:hypothetical protein
MRIPVLILARIQYTPNHLRWGCFVHAFHPERLQRPTKGPVVPLPGTEKPGIASFSAISQTPLRLLPLLPAPVSFPAAAPYPVGRGSAAIRLTMLPKSRHVRWLSANSSQ